MAKKVILSAEVADDGRIKKFLEKVSLYNAYIEKTIDTAKIKDFINELKKESNQSYSENGNAPLNAAEVYMLLFGYTVSSQKKDLQTLIFDQINPNERLSGDSEASIRSTLSEIKTNFTVTSTTTPIKVDGMGSWRTAIVPKLTLIFNTVNSGGSGSSTNMGEDSYGIYRKALGLIEKHDKDKAVKIKAKGSIQAKDIDKCNNNFVGSFTEMSYIFMKVSNEKLFDGAHTTLYDYLGKAESAGDTDVLDKISRKDFAAISDGASTLDSSISPDQIKLIESWLDFRKSIIDNIDSMEYVIEWYDLYYEKTFPITFKDIDDKIVKSTSFTEIHEMMTNNDLFDIFDIDEKKLKDDMYKKVRTYARWAVYNDINGNPVNEKDRTETTTNYDPFTTNKLLSGRDTLSTMVGNFMNSSNNWNDDQRETAQQIIKQICLDVYGKSPLFIWNLIKTKFSKLNRHKVLRKIGRAIPKLLVHNRFVDELKKMVALPKSW